MLRFTPEQNGTKLEPTSKPSDGLDITEAQAKEIYNNFIQGQYDQFIFCDKPQVTNDLKILLSQYNRDFIQRLFTKCDSDKSLTFWLNDAGAKLPKDTWALAVNLGNNIVVLKYLKEHRWFDDLSKEDKEGLLIRAERFKGEGLEFLRNEFAKTKCKAVLS